MQIVKIEVDSFDLLAVTLNQDLIAKAGQILLINPKDDNIFVLDKKEAELTAVVNLYPETKTCDNPTSEEIVHSEKASEKKSKFNSRQKFKIDDEFMVAGQLEIMVQLINFSVLDIKYHSRKKISKNCFFQNKKSFYSRVGSLIKHGWIKEVNYPEAKNYLELTSKAKKAKNKIKSAWSKIIKEV